MAIVQISRITQRKGLEVDLPQPLAGAELGWAVDERKLFIGNGSLEDGAPVVGNTEILTEFSDVLALASAYTYKGDAAGYTVQTGETQSDPIAQSLQRRLDSDAIITNFGATGDGETDVTSNINRAFNQLYCQSVVANARRSLYFPAGVYIITDTLNIPTYANLYGDGSNSTIVYFRVQPHTSTITYPAGTLVYSAERDDYYRSNFAVPINTDIGALTEDNEYYWGNINNNAPTPLPPYIARTADSAQDIGVNIGNTTGSVPPQNIQISGMKFITDQRHDGFLFEKASMCTFRGVAIQGPLESTELDDGDNIAAVRWSSGESLESNNIVLDDCSFSNFNFATKTNQNIAAVTISNSSFEFLFQGVVLERNNNTGATGFRIVNNSFDQIYAQGIQMSSGVTLNASAHNIFYNVGQRLDPDFDNASHSIIDINADNNISVGDMFVRNNDQSRLFPRINLNNKGSITLSNSSNGITFYQTNLVESAYVTSENDQFSNQLSLGRYQRAAGISDTVADTDTTISLAQVDGLKIAAFKVDYTIKRNNVVRTGTMTAVGNQTGTTVGFSYTDDYVENGDTEVTMSIVHNNSASVPTMTVSYIATGANPGEIRYSINHIS